MLRTLLIGLLLISLVGFGGLTWVALQPPAAPPPDIAAAPPPPPPVRATILVAAHPLRAGALLAPADIATQEVEAGAVPPDARTDGTAARNALVGAMIRRPLVAQEPLRAGDLVLPGEHGFLAAVLSPGMRAVSIGTDAVSGAAGLIWPGDRVDLVLTQTLGDQSVPAARRVAGETVLTNIRVIAIDQLLVQGAVGLDPAAERATRTVTLEVTSAQAERVAVSARLGQLALAVRSAEVAPTAEAPATAPGVTWAGDVSPALRGTAGTPGAAPPQRTLRVHQGTAKTEEFRF